MIAYKLFNARKNGTIGPLFINRRQVVPLGEWLDAEHHPTKGYADRMGWHACSDTIAPHLSRRGRRWYKVELDDFSELNRPSSQGGKWFIANRMKVIGAVP